MNLPTQGDIYLSPKQLAQKVGVSASTIRRWEKKGIIRSKRDERNQRKFHPSTVEEAKKHREFLKKRKSQTSKENLYYSRNDTPPVSSIARSKSSKTKLLSKTFEALVVIFISFLLLYAGLTFALGKSFKPNIPNPLTLIDFKNSEILSGFSDLHQSQVKVPSSASKKSVIEKQPSPYTAKYENNDKGRILGTSYTTSSKHNKKEKSFFTGAKNVFSFFKSLLTPESSNESQVLSGHDYLSPNRLVSNIRWIFNDGVEIGGEVLIVGEGEITALGRDLNLGDNEITASNVVYGLIEGEGIAISAGQFPTIENTGIVSLNDNTGSLELTGSDGISISDDLELTNTGVLSLEGTGDQVNVSGETGDITLSLPQNISPGSSPTFNGLTLTTLNVGSSNFQVNSSGNITSINGVTYSFPSSQAAGSSYILTNDGSGTLVWESVTGSTITPDSLDWSEFKDAMTLDATTTIDMDTNTADLNFDSGTFFIDSSTNRIGIGSTSPSHTLQVVGTSLLGELQVGSNGYISDTNGNISLNDGITVQSGFSLGFNAGNGRIDFIDFQPSGDNDALSITASTSHSVDDTRLINLDHNAAVTGSNKTIYGLYSSVSSSGSSENIAGYFSATNAANNYAAIFENGNVGIGTTAPSAQFAIGASSQFRVDSSGDLTRINDVAYTWPGSQGSTDNVLTNNGSGTLSWGTIGSSSITADSLDWSEFTDTMTLDATTTIDMDSNSADLNFDDGTLYIDNAGNVGVGTTNPTQLLHAYSADGSALVQAQSTATGNVNVGFRMTGGSANADWIMATQRADLFGATENMGFWNSSGGAVMTTTSTGNVGIGTNNPSVKLDVEGSNAQVHINGVGTEQAILSLQQAGTTRALFGTNAAANGFFTGTAPGDFIVRADTGDLWLGAFAAKEVHLVTNNSEAVTIDSSGNVGIGTTDPPALLSVGSSSEFRVDSSGDLTRINDISYTWPGSQGSTDNVLTNNGSGTLSWGTVGSSSITADSLDWSEFTDTMTLDATTTIDMDSNSADLNFDDGTLYIDNAGNVGVGTTAPSEQLHLAGGNFLQTAGDPSEVGSLSLASAGLSIDVSGRYAYVGKNNASNEFSIIDISDPSAPSEVSSLDLAHNAIAVEVSGKYAYVGINVLGGDEFRIIDISNPSAPTEISSLDLDFTVNDIYVSGKYAYVGNNSGDEFSVVDISDPTNPTKAGSLSLASSGRGVYVLGGYAYVVSGSTGDDFHVIDISDPTSPSEVGSTSLPTAGNDVYVSGKYAYAVTDSTGNDFHVIDVSDPTTPTEVTSIDLADSAKSLHISGKYAYVGSSSTGDDFHVIDISDPTSPSEVASIGSSGTVYGLYISGKYAYLVTGSSNFFKVIDISGIDAPTATIGDLAVGTLDVWENAVIGNNLYAQNGLNVGPGGLYVDEGEVAFDSNSGDTAFLFRQKGTGDILNVFDSSTEVFTIEDGGNIGIGSTAPTALLDVNSNFTVTSGGNMTVNGNTTLGDAVGDTLTINSGDWTLANATTVDLAASTSALNFESGLLNLDTSNTRVGIGTTAPSSQLDIFGTSAELRISYDASNYSTLSIGSDGTLTFADSGTTTATFSETGNTIDVPTTFTSAGDVSIANDLQFTNQTASYIKSNAPLYIQAGESHESNDLTLQTYNSGNIVLDLQGTGYQQLAGTDPSIVFDTTTSGDTDYWMGVVEDGAGDDNDTFSIGDGSTPGSNRFLTIDTGGNVGIGTTNPSSFKLQVDGSIGPQTDDTYDLGSNTLRWQDLYLGPDTLHIGTSTSDEGTLSYNTTSDNLEFTTTGGDYYFDIANGNVGIGTTSTSRELQVAGNFLMTGFSFEMNSTGNGYFILDRGGNTSDGYLELQTAGTTTAAIGHDGDSTDNLYFATGSMSTGKKMTIESGGNVGIGTTVPNQLLHLKKTSEVAIRLDEDTISGTAWDIGAGVGTTGSFGIQDLDAGQTRLIIDLSGRIGIGTTSPSTKLHLHDGALCVDDATASCPAGGTAGTIYAESTTITEIDLAENYPSKKELKAGEIVMLDTENAEHVKKAEIENRENLIGVISTKPGITLGGHSKDDQYPVALAGRVPVKISKLSKDIRIGDNITISPEQGKGQKAESEGIVIGTALESWTCGGKDTNGTDGDGSNGCEESIMVFVNTTYYHPSALSHSEGGTTEESLSSNPDSWDPSLIAQDETLEVEREAIFYNNVNMLGDTTVKNLAVNSYLNIGLLSIDSEDNSINVLAGDLNLQSKDGTGNISMFNDVFKFNKKGLLEVKGTVLAERIEAQKITAGQINVKDGGNRIYMDETELLDCHSEGGGTTTEESLCSDLDSRDPSSQKAPQDDTNINESNLSTIGTGTIETGDTEIVVETSAVAENSKVFMTPMTKTGNQSLYVEDIVQNESFTVKIETPQEFDIEFNWWVIGVTYSED